MIPPRGADRLIDLALAEDAVRADITSRAIFSASHMSTGIIEAGERLVVAGTGVASRVFLRVDRSIRVERHVDDGADVERRGRLLTIRGRTRSLLAAERTALNFLQRLSGIATLSRRFAEAAAGSGVRVLDTRKTTPGWRALEKAAVESGGCRNHRASLAEAVLIKDNHIAAAGSLRRAVLRARAHAPRGAPIEVEAATLAEVRTALGAGADTILLDNMSPARVRRAVRLIAGRATVEVSGGIRLETVRSYCLTGVDVISVGALTHSAGVVDIGMRVTR
jgi:nicotinate-nucleotide pyrophosphorylase (carboxylating)